MSDGTPARLDLFRRRFTKIVPAAHDIGQRRWNNIRAGFAKALRHPGFELLPGRRLAPLSGLGSDPALTRVRPRGGSGATNVVGRSRRCPYVKRT